MGKAPRQISRSILDGLQTQARAKGASVVDMKMLGVLFLDADLSTECEEPGRWETSRLSTLSPSAKAADPQFCILYLHFFRDAIAQ